MLQRKGGKYKKNLLLHVCIVLYIYCFIYLFASMSRLSNTIAHTGLYTAVCVVIGLILTPVPNIELITLFVFLGGYIYGIKQGVIIGTTGGFLFSALNPWGSGLAFPPLIVSQVIGFGLAGLTGALIYKTTRTLSEGKLKTVLFGLSGGVLTVVYHLLITIFTSELAGYSLTQAGIYFAGGMLFGLWHIISNILFFSILSPLLIRAASRFSFNTRLKQI